MNTSNLRQMNLTSNYPVFERDHRSIYRTRYSLKDHYVASSLCKEIFRLPCMYVHTYIGCIENLANYYIQNDMHKRTRDDSPWGNWSTIFSFNA